MRRPGRRMRETHCGTPTERTHGYASLSILFDPNMLVARAQPGGHHSQAWATEINNLVAARSVPTCRGCRHRRARNDWSHNRVIGQCCYPHDEPEVLEREARTNHIPRGHYGNLFEPCTCRHAATRCRAYAPRHGHDPRGRAKPAISEPATGLPASNRHRETGERAEL